MGKIKRSFTMGGGKTLLLGFALLVIALAATGCEQPDNNVADYITTADGTWEIYTAQGLLDWNAYVMKNTGSEDTPKYPNLGTSATLMADISLEGKNWTPVGTNTNQYTGTFDGNRYTISNLKIDSPKGKYLGLLGYIAPDGIVKDLTLSDVEISGNKYIGGIAGYNRGTIENCSVSGSVSGTDSVGGIVGYNNGGKITACYNTGDVSGLSNIGGIVGYNNGGKITACYNTGDVSGSLNFGGIVGENYSENITACYWSGETLKGIGNEESASGVIYVDSSWDKSIINRLNNEIYLYNQENTDNICNFHYVEGNDFPKLESGAPEFIPGKIEKASFASTELTLKIGGFKKLELILEPEGVEYSIITWKSSNEKVATVDKQGLVCAHKTGITTITATIDKKISAECTINVSATDKDSDGYEITTDGTWNIYTADGLLAWNRYVTNNYVKSTDAYGYTYYVMETNATLMDDITLSYPEEGQSNWTPVGYNNYSSKVTYYYAGTFDGGGHTISNLKIDSSDSDNLGLFGYISPDGVVKDLRLSKVEISGDNNIGGITGNNYGTIENCSVSGRVSGGLNTTGGIVGYNYGTITACYNTGTVSSESIVNSISGIVGYNYGTITACYNTGKVSGYEQVGGIVGGNYDGTITACYNTGIVSGYKNIGGIAGENNAIETIRACYWSVPEGSSITGIGQGSGSTTQVGENGATWKAATSAMNDAISDWNKKNSNKCDYHFVQENGETEPPILAEGAPTTSTT